MRRLLTVGDVKYLVDVPSTTLEILEYRVRIASLVDEDEAMALVCMGQWASRYVVGEVPQSPSDIIVLCSAICAAAEISLETLANVRKGLRIQAGVPTDFVAEGSCKCPKCRGQVVEVPDGVCKFEAIEPDTFRILAEVGNLKRLDIPYWAAQLQREMDRVESDYAAHSSQEREKKKESQKRTEQIWDRRDPGWRVRRN